MRLQIKQINIWNMSQRSLKWDDIVPPLWTLIRLFTFVEDGCCLRNITVSFSVKKALSNLKFYKTGD